MTMASPLPPGWIKGRLYHLLAPLVALLAMAVFEQTRVGQLLEDQTVNLRFKVRSSFDRDADPRLVFIGIDQQSLDIYGRYPWPRSVISNFLTNLAKANSNPYAAAFDVLYVDPSSDPKDDADLGNAAALLPNVITGALGVNPLDKSDTNAQENLGDALSIKAAENKTEEGLKDSGPTAPYTHIHGDAQRIRGYEIATLPVDPLRKNSFFGFVNDDPSKVDDIRHTIPLIIRVKDRIYPSLALQTLCQMLAVDVDKVVVNVGQDVVLKNFSGKSWTIPVNALGEYTINYRSNDSFKKNCLSFGLFSRALDDYANKNVPLPAACKVTQKTLVIGETATALTDLGPTPVDAQSPLPYTHLNVINNVLQNDYLRFVPWKWVAIGWLALTWVTLLRLKDALLGEAVVVPIILALLYVVFAFAIFWKWSLQIDLASPVLAYGVVNFGGIVLRWREEQHGREQIKSLFSRMVSPEIMNHLLDHPENMKLGGSDRASTILFSDIRDYTKFSEGLSAAEVVRQLNIYFERMFGCVTECKGTFHKFIGDAVMAAWGDIAIVSAGPEQDARNAVRSALMMRSRLRELNQERDVEGLTPLRIGIGLNHGVVQAGMLGAVARMEFTVMGDEVNTASRLEGITKEFHTDLAISDSVRTLLGDDFLVRRLGFIQLKGKTKATVVYEVLGEKTDLAHAKRTPEFVTAYETAFDHFLARRFTAAADGFSACDKLVPDDYCVKEYLRASRDFSSNPPPPDWDGRIVMKTK